MNGSRTSGGRLNGEGGASFFLSTNWADFCFPPLLFGAILDEIRPDDHRVWVKRGDIRYCGKVYMQAGGVSWKCVLQDSVEIMFEAWFHKISIGWKCPWT